MRFSRAEDDRQIAEKPARIVHQHPQEIDLTNLLPAPHPKLTFKVTMPQPGRFVGGAS